MALATPDWRLRRTVIFSMVEDEISVLSAFKDSGYDIILADEVKNEIGYRKIPFKNIPLDELPDLDEKLENPDLREYIEQLQSTILPPIEFDDM